MIRYQLNSKNENGYQHFIDICKSKKELVCYTYFPIEEETELNVVKESYPRIRYYSVFDVKKNYYKHHICSPVFYGFKYPEELCEYVKKHDKKCHAFKIVECVIPKGTIYAEGIFDESEFEGYAAKKYICKEILGEWHEF